MVTLGILPKSLSALICQPENAATATVPTLASRVSMSRSAFATRFRAHVGERLLDHLTQWRMAPVARLMRESRGMKLAAMAAAVGYESETSFDKVFVAQPLS
jgi:transcriptional regulator GlxA family with amidase domain